MGTIRKPPPNDVTKSTKPMESPPPSSDTIDSNVDADSPTDSEHVQLNNNNLVKIEVDTSEEKESGKRARKFTVLASRFMHRPSKTNIKDTKQVAALLQDEQQARRLRNQRGRERRATITIAVIVLAFTVCWLPFSLVYLIDRICECGMRDTKAFAVIFWLGYCNSAVNPMLYSIFNRDFRHAFMRLLCRKRKG